MKRQIALLISLFWLSAPVWADGDLYIGASVGSVALNTDFDDFDDNIDSDDTGFSATLGVQFSELLALEGGYSNFGTYSALFSTPLGTTSLNAELSGFDVFGVLRLPLGPLDVFGKAGVVFWDSEAEAVFASPPGLPNRLSSDNDGTDLAFGVGADIALGNQLSLRGEFEWFDIDETDEVSFISIGLLYRF